MVAAKRTWLALVLASGLALGEGAPDLDFSEDFPVPDRPGPGRSDGNPGDRVTQKSPPSAAPAKAESTHAWAYWTAGLAGLAAGGAAWYFHWGDRPAPDPVRDNQVFTDDAD